jgi:hypothetical protein
VERCDPVRSLIIVILCTGCVTREIRASPAELEAARHLLSTQQPAPVRTKEDGLFRVTPRQQIEVVTTSGDRFALTVDSVMRDCADHTTEEGRLCELHGVAHVVLGHRRHVHPAVWAVPLTVGIVGGTFAGIGGLVYCARNCENASRQVSQITLGVLGGLLLYAIFRRGWG